MASFHHLVDALARHCSLDYWSDGRTLVNSANCEQEALFKFIDVRTDSRQKTSPPNWPLVKGLDGEKESSLRALTQKKPGSITVGTFPTVAVSQGPDATTRILTPAEIG
jgi:hypothetical protein